MTDDTRSQTRLAVARIGILLFLVFFGLRLLSIALTEEALVAAAAGVATPAPAAPTIFVRFEWLSHCAPEQTQIGLYTASDAPCQPSQIASLTWLQSQLAASGLLTAGEYLEPAPAPRNPGCDIVILNSATNQPSGHICSDANGFYRMDINGKDLARRVQLEIGD